MNNAGRWGALGCLGLAATGCFGAFQLEAVSRASREFSCPAERIAAVERADIANNVYDVNACGKLVRYSCISSQHVPAQCTREPDPSKWDLDPALLVNVPKPLGMRSDVHVTEVCSHDAHDRCDPCLERAGTDWRWHQCTGFGPTGDPMGGP
jgi:hypothetical protein